MADEDSFGSILRSEAMLRGPGKNYTSLIASLTKLGIKALDILNEKLKELIDIMERADFSKWLIQLRSKGELPDEMQDEIHDALERIIAEATSRTQLIEELRIIKGNAEKQEN